MSGAGGIKADGSDDVYLYEIKDANLSHVLNGQELHGLWLRAIRQGKQAVYIVQFPDFTIEAHITPRG
jgi:hypothetical protein